MLKTGEEVLYKVTTFVPESSADAVRHAMGLQEQEKLATMSTVALSLHGEGRFIGNEASHPVIGEAGALTVAPEVQVKCYR